MSQTQDNNKRIAKNTVMLYLRMIVSMVVGLFTSRILLQALGVVDYGIYNIVGGFVAMFSIVSGSLTSAISRFLTFGLGKGDMKHLKVVFSTSILVLLGLSLAILVFAETVGLWFFYEKLVIPDDRIQAAFWVFQLSVLSFIVSLLSTPYNSCIVSHERMDAFAYISIYEVVCKLLICYAVVHAPMDRLVFYAILLFGVGLSVRFIYTWYCKKHFEECAFQFSLDKKLLKDMFGFASWNFLGSAGWVLRSEGGTILFNLFGGPAANAANAVASALCGAVTGFVTSFTQAFNPQITKNYAAQKYLELNRLLMYGSKLSFYMMFFMGLPVMLNTHFVLHLWLGNVPEHSTELVRLIILFSLSETLSTPLITAKLATGDIRNYQLVVGGVQLLSLPLAYLALKLGAPIESIYVSYFIVSVGCLFARMFLLRGDFPYFSVRKFMSEVAGNVWLVAGVASVVPYLVYRQLEEGWICLLVTGTVSVISCSLVMFFIGLKKSERQKVKVFVAAKVKSRYGKG